MEDSLTLISQLTQPELALSCLTKLWEDREKQTWQETPELYLAIARRIKARSRPFWLYEIVSEGLESKHLTKEQTAELTQTAALSLARTGASRKAENMLLALLECGHSDVETLAILGRIYKDNALKSTVASDRTHFLQKAAESYEKASAIDPDSYYPLINQATLALLLGNESSAFDLANRVLALHQDAESDNEDYWLTASLGEAYLILGNFETAASYYRSAIAMAKGDYFSLSSMRKQAELILQAKSIEKDEFEGVFEAPTIAIISGHRADAPDRSEPRFPASSLTAVSEAIDSWIEEHNPQIAYGSAAAGADLLFCESAIQHGVELSIVLPFDIGQFRHYLANTSDESWLKRFEFVTANARKIIELSQGEYDESIQGPAIYDFTNQTILGSARSDAKFLGGEVRSLAVWDENVHAIPGGTADCIGLWRESGQSVDGLINPLSGEKVSTSEIAAWPIRSETHDSPQQIKAILFADVVGFSALTDPELPAFFNEFLFQVANAMNKTGIKPLTRNSWGDAYYLVFETALDACLFALAFQEAAKKIRWVPKRREQPLQFRIGLNAGPVFRIFEPLCDLLAFVGQATNRAARIEPIVDEGQIYVSEYLAALIMVDDPEGIALDYVGRKQLPKKFGSTRVFALRRKAAR